MKTQDLFGCHSCIPRRTNFIILLVGEKNQTNFPYGGRGIL